MAAYTRCLRCAGAPRRPVPGFRYHSVLTCPSIQASGGSVALPAAEYDYNSHWTPLLAGLSPAGMAASLAAPEPYEAERGDYYWMRFDYSSGVEYFVGRDVAPGLGRAVGALEVSVKAVRRDGAVEETTLTRR